ncbi:MAG: YggS family pyridoxal phosphate-dependent enzyme [Elusimicrobiota bacterium]|jgi:hypothetical protein
MVLERLDGIRRRIEAAAARGDRDASAVDVIAVVKKAPTMDLRALAASGRVRWFGESRVQDAARRREELGPDAARVRWRFVGHLQTNKAVAAAGLFERLDSLESLKLAASLDALAAEAGNTLPVLVQVKLTGRDAQSGVDPEALGEFLEKLRGFPRLKAQGLMAIAPLTERVEETRPHFRRMKELLDRHFPAGTVPDRELSMGMSQDFEVAVEEGATLVRIGTALFNA